MTSSAVPEEYDKIRDAATPADLDLLDRIVELQSLAAARRPDKAREERYEALREQVTAELVEGGPRWYLDEAGNKRFAYAVSPEQVEADIEELVELAAAGKLPALNVDKVFPRKLDAAELRRALSKNAIPGPVVAKHIHITPKTGYTKFADDVSWDDA
jgi:hypothetical protein